MGLYVGLDLHSTHCYTGIIDEEGNKRLGRKLANDRGKIISALSPYQKEIVGIVVESTYNGYWLVDALMEEGYPVHLANPAAMKQYEGIKYLNDQHDAFWLADMLKLGILPEGYIYPKEMRGVRDLLRQRSRFVVQKTSLKHTLQQIYCNYTGATLSNNAIHQIEVDEIQGVLSDPTLSYQVENLLSAIRFLEERIKAIETHVLNRIEEGPTYPLLTSILGGHGVRSMDLTLIYF